MISTPSLTEGERRGKCGCCDGEAGDGCVGAQQCALNVERLKVEKVERLSVIIQDLHWGIPLACKLQEEEKERRERKLIA